MVLTWRAIYYCVPVLLKYSYSKRNNGTKKKFLKNERGTSLFLKTDKNPDSVHFFPPKSFHSCPFSS